MTHHATEGNAVLSLALILLLIFLLLASVVICLSKAFGVLLIGAKGVWGDPNQPTASGQG
jgi:hypothetical protein